MTACPTCGGPYDPLRDAPPQPSHSSAGIRRQAREHVAAAVNRARTARTTVNTEKETTDE